MKQPLIWMPNVNKNEQGKKITSEKSFGKVLKNYYHK